MPWTILSHVCPVPSGAKHLAAAAIPWDQIAENEYAILAYTHRGGHLGWFEWGGKRWFVSAVGDLFDLVEKAISS